MTTPAPPTFTAASDAADLARSVTPQQAAHILWTVDDHHYGMEPGSFTSRLIEAIRYADPVNQMLLAQVFPGYVAAVMLLQGYPGGGTDGTRHLRDRAKHLW